MITFSADAGTAASTVKQLSASITSAMAGIDAKMQDTARKTGQATDAWRSSLAGLSQTVQRTHVEQGKLSQAFLQTGQAAQTQLNQFERLRQQYLKTHQAASGLSSELGSLLNSFKGVIALAGIGLSVQGLIDFGKSVVDAGIAHDRLMLSLKGALGTAQAAGEAYAFVEGVANRLGIGLLSAGEGFAKLSAATQGTVVQGEQTRALFVAISEASRVMGLSSAETGGIVTALTQIVGKNTVSMEELRQQLGERLPSALRLTAKEMGVATSKFIEMVSKGQVLATDFIPAVTRAMTQMGKEAPAAAQSVQAALERVGNAWFTLKVAIAQSGVLELVAHISEEMTRIINQTTNWINRTKRLAGEMGLAPMVGEMQRVTQEIQRWQEILAEPNLFGPREDEANRQIKALEAQRDALAQNIAVKQKLVDQEEKVRTVADATVKQEIAHRTAKDAEIAVLTKASQAWITLGDDIKEVETSLKALRSFDVESLQALQIDPFAADFEQQFNRAEAFLLKKHQELMDKRAGLTKGDASRAAREAGQSAVEIAKAREEALATGLKREEALIEQSATERRRLIDQSASESLTTAGPGAVESVVKQRSEAIRRVAIEEAQALETLRLDTLTKQAAGREATLQAEIAAAGKNLSAQTKAQAELTNLYADTEVERAKITQQRADVELHVSKKSLDDQVKDARDLNKLIEETAQDRLQSSIDVSDAEIALIESQIEGEVLTYQDGAVQIEAIQQRRIETTRELYTRQADAAIAAIDAEVRETEAGQAQIVKIKSGLNDQLWELDIRRETETQAFLNKQQAQYERFVDRVAGSLATIFEDLLSGTLNILDTFKQLFLRTISQIVAEAATRTIVVPIITSVLGLSGGTGRLLQGAGLINTLVGPQSILGTFFSQTGPLATAFSSLTSILNTGASAVGGGIADLITTVTGIPVTNLPASGLMALGGLAGLGGGIFSALTAKNTGGMVGGAIGAAGGAVALASALGLVLTPVLGPIGLALAAIAPLLGNFLGGMGAPAGPRFALGGLGGLGVGADGGNLQVTGALTSQIGRQARIPEGVDPAAIQEALNASVSQLVRGMVEAINQVSVDPAALLGETQQALNEAMAGALRINSSSAKNFQKDMEEQLKFIGVQVSSFFLRPLNDGFRQLESADLDEQLSRLPETTQGMVYVFRTMNERLDELSTVANTDVLRQLSSVRTRVEDFGNALADTVRVIATSIVDQISDTLIAEANVLLDEPLAEQIRRFGAVMNESFGALDSLRTSQEALQGAGLDAGGITGQIGRLTTLMIDTAAEVSREIVTGALTQLSGDLEQVTAQAVGVQASMVNTLFTDSLRALESLFQVQSRLNAEGLDSTAVATQFERLLGGMLDTAFRVIREAIDPSQFDVFLGVLISIPEALARLNPELERLRNLGISFAQVVQPISQAIASWSDALLTTEQRVTMTASQMTDLRRAIAAAGDSADQALPLYAALAQAIQANAQAQIDATNEAAQQQTDAINAAYDAQLEAINIWADAAAEAWNAWADQAMTDIQAWVDAMTTAVNDWADAAQTTAGQLATVNDILLGEMSPADQRTTLEAQKAALEAVVIAGGEASAPALTELIEVNRKLLELAKQSDDLAAQQEATDELKAIQKILTDQLIAATGQSDPILAQIAVSLEQKAWLEYIAQQQEAATAWVQQVQTAQLQAIVDGQEAQTQALNTSREAQLTQVTAWQEATVRAIQEGVVAQLAVLNNQIYNLFILQAGVARLLGVPAQRGGLLTSGMASMNHAGTGPLALASGGMVHAMLEPGERVVPPPLSMAQQGALLAANAAVPRFASGGWTVPGSGSGDTVPAWVPSGSFVLNRNASKALGFQGGGVAPSSSAPSLPPIIIDLRGSQFGSPADASKVKQIIERDVIKIVEEYHRRTRVDTRL